MVDGGEQAAAFQVAFDRGLPALLGAVRIGVARGVVTASPATFALRCSLLAFVRMAEWWAERVLDGEQLGGPAPAAFVSPPDGWPQPDPVEPIVPRRPAGHPQAPLLPR